MATFQSLEEAKALPSDKINYDNKFKQFALATIPADQDPYLSILEFKKYNGVEFVENDEFDIFLKDNYLKFINDINKNYNKFRDFIIIKQICYKIPAMTDSTMRIYINPIYEI